MLTEGPLERANICATVGCVFKVAEKRFITIVNDGI
jgi:hypothetical protein